MRAPLPAWQRVVHGLVIVAGWLIFGWSWRMVLRDQAPEFGQVTFLILGAGLLIPMITAYWVIHNVRIFRAKGERKRAPIVVERYETDWEGRKIVAVSEEVRRGRYILIETTEDLKIFHVADHAADLGAKPEVLQGA